MINLNENTGNEQTEVGLSLFTDAFSPEKCERLLAELHAIRQDTQLLSGGTGIEKLMGVILQLDGVINEYERVSGNFLKAVRAISAKNDMDGAAALLLEKIYSDVARDRAAILEGRGIDLELTGLAELQPQNNGRTRPSESLGTY